LQKLRGARGFLYFAIWYFAARVVSGCRGTDWNSPKAREARFSMQYSLLLSNNSEDSAVQRASIAVQSAKLETKRIEPVTGDKRAPVALNLCASLPASERSTQL
jgi:hypothetical protein